jgi:glycosyltransferase involved in cell wall biosynthesis
VPDAPDRDASSPLVSVVIPVFNQGQYLSTAIESVLAQGYEPIELIVVDDGSTDDTPAVLRRYADQITSVRQPNHGASHALNRGIEASRGSLVCWLSADDEFLPGKLQAQVQAFRDDPALWLCATGFDVVDATGELVRRIQAPRWRHPDPFVAVFWDNPINGSTVMVRRVVFDRMGYFDTTLRADVDADMWLRIAPVGRFLQLDGVYLRYRVHAASLSANRPLMIDSMTRVRLPHIESGALRRRIGPNRGAARILAIMAAEYGWRGLGQLGHALLRESRAAGRAPRFQLLAGAALAIQRWERPHRLAIRHGARLRRELRRRREQLRRT